MSSLLSLETLEGKKTVSPFFLSMKIFISTDSAFSHRDPHAYKPLSLSSRYKVRMVSE